MLAVAAPQPPTVFEGVANTVAVIVLQVEFLMLRTALLRAQIRLYAVQSLAVSVLAVVVPAGPRDPGNCMCWQGCRWR